MFHTNSPYSPFFTSGLLSEPCTCDTSPSSPGPRRGSLPTDSPRSPSSADGSSAYYFTLQAKRDTSEFRSFLSLDLAESNSLRSASLRRKASSSIRAVTMFPHIPEVPNTHHLAPPLPTSIRLRLSRDSLRTIPSPKPAPSTTLPAVPTQTTRRPSSPSISSIASMPPRLPSIAIGPSLGLTLERASQSAPSLVISRTPAPPLVLILPNRDDPTSTVSTRVRKINRSHALARLEGRSDSTRRKAMAKSMPAARNFMYMSDDEDDEDRSYVDVESRQQSLSPILEPEDVVFPAPPTLRLQHGAKTGFPSLVTSRSSFSRTKRNQSSRTSKDWFPLKSFIDLQGDDSEMSGWSWRSFIEVASVS